MDSGTPPSPAHPGCIVFLLDQSYSMKELAVGAPSRTKAAVLADAVNNSIHDLVVSAVADRAEGPRHLYDVGTIGYGRDVASAWSGDVAGRELVPIDQLARAPGRVEERTSLAGHQRRLPVWVEPRADGGTPVCAALDRTGRLLADWVAAHPASPPPLVVNMGDGASTDGDPIVWASRLRGLSTEHGPVMLFNLNITALSKESIAFPHLAEDLADDFARTLFLMSSVLTEPMRRAAERVGHRVHAAARGLVYHADAATLQACLRVGTRALVPSPSEGSR